MMRQRISANVIIADFATVFTTILIPAGKHLKQSFFTDILWPQYGNQMILDYAQATFKLTWRDLRYRFESFFIENISTEPPILIFKQPRVIWLDENRRKKRVQPHFKEPLQAYYVYGRMRRIFISPMADVSECGAAFVLKALKTLPIGYIFDEFGFVLPNRYRIETRALVRRFNIGICGVEFPNLSEEDKRQISLYVSKRRVEDRRALLGKHELLPMPR